MSCIVPNMRDYPNWWRRRAYCDGKLANEISIAPTQAVSNDAGDCANDDYDAKMQDPSCYLLSSKPVVVLNQHC